jgi:hypothetical protein
LIYCTSCVGGDISAVGGGLASGGRGGVVALGSALVASVINTSGEDVLFGGTGLSACLVVTASSFMRVAIDCLKLFSWHNHLCLTSN